MWLLCFFFQAEDGIRDYKVTGVQTCALPISFLLPLLRWQWAAKIRNPIRIAKAHELNASLDIMIFTRQSGHHRFGDRKSTRLNSSHLVISYAVFCLKKKKKSNVV